MRERKEETGPPLERGDGMHPGCDKVVAVGLRQGASVAMMVMTMTAASAATDRFAKGDLEQKGGRGAVSWELMPLPTLPLLLLPTPPPSTVRRKQSNRRPQRELKSNTRAY